MPELPEVETVRRGLAPVLEGARLTGVEVRRGDLRFPFPEGLAARLEGARVLRLGRRAKYLLAALDTGETWATHLGMSGRFSVHAAAGRAARPGAFHYAAATNPAHTHLRVRTEAGALLEYNDPRRFGYMLLMETQALHAHPFLAGLGPEPLGPDFTIAHLAGACAGRRQSVKATLLDQRVVAGLGNIYVCEALHRAGVAPARAAGRIARARLGGLVEAVRTVLGEAIEAGGSSLRDYADADGALGYFQLGFRVYGRAGQPCQRPGCGGVVARRVQGGRSSFFCPACQR